MSPEQEVRLQLALKLVAPKTFAESRISEAEGNKAVEFLKPIAEWVVGDDESKVRYEVVDVGVDKI